MNNLQEKNKHLGNILKGMGRVMVAFSGGVDSAVVLKRAQEELGDNVLAVVVNSELFRDSEFEASVQLAENLGVRVHQTEMKELENPDIIANNPESWYFSKKLLYTHLNKLAEEMGYSYVLDGMIMDDEADFRPGLKARTEEGIRSVLQEADFYKTEVRALAKELKLPVWDKVASCSLASRFPYGTKLNKQIVQQVDQAELYLKGLGFEEVRVRYHDNVARIEVAGDKILELLDEKEEIQNKLVSFGFDYVSVDLLGYRTGSMNEVIEQDQWETKLSAHA
ncbi:PP-loop superfamily ATP-binding protein [Oceanobacillus oncorhynchi subsp. incaldanensis]|uniref:NH(3)-dependent NAD(+) synthetase n=2 Tax=Oceanobacillus TaxID=182709 RepID=A0A0A1MNA5_9BACI|nr:ATP-dependent sacrificial sulfur transferase LarE [Oceanobacillus oncorhynchi]MDM8102446.1 ATP-dependent sacrificial sulfur transferase LarE [Oceanobacillus oncorhynchi]GIO20830.1 PP-loop superfamily ATP-binding protein [Oceanobacillus oncorhynchi subsp. incaldanensis]CEI84548.1 NH(3)-dependent NAD(+) synthetase [Oceanobacillus oncorhynchi]